MAQLTKRDMMKELAELGEYFWAGEAEIAKNFLEAPHAPEDHILWLKHQCLRELRGPGLLHRPSSRTEWFIKNVEDDLPSAETHDGRLEMEYALGQLLEEFQHFKYCADIQ